MRDTAPAPDLTATERAIATMAARRDAATCPLTGDEWLIYDELLHLQDVIARLVAELDTLRGDNRDYERALAIPGEDAA